MFSAPFPSNVVSATNMHLEEISLPNKANIEKRWQKSHKICMYFPYQICLSIFVLFACFQPLQNF